MLLATGIQDNAAITDDHVGSWQPECPEAFRQETTVPINFNAQKPIPPSHSSNAFGGLDGDLRHWFDEMSETARRLLNVPMAQICLLTDKGPAVASAMGLNITWASSETSFSKHTVENGRGIVVADARTDPRFSQSALVTRGPCIRAVAGAVIKSKDDQAIGVISVFDTDPREFLVGEVEDLERLAGMIASHLQIQEVASKASKAERRLVEAVDALPDGLVFYDDEDRLVLSDKRYREIYAESADLIVPGARFEDIIRGGVERGQYPEAAGREDEFVRERVKIHQNPGDPVEQELPGDRWLRIQEGKTTDGGLIGFRFDITTIKRQERKLSHLVWTDGLTGTLNRTRFVDLANREFGRSVRHQRPLAVLVADVDHFKQINDQYGHAAGDHALIELAKRWQANLRDHDLIGRLGGEEFGILLPETSEVDAFCVAEKIRQRTEALPFRYDGALLNITVSIGIAVVCEGTKCIDDVLLAADKSLYEVKRNGRNGCLLMAA